MIDVLFFGRALQSVLMKQVVVSVTTGALGLQQIVVDQAIQPPLDEVEVATQ